MPKNIFAQVYKARFEAIKHHLLLNIHFFAQYNSDKEVFTLVIVIGRGKKKNPTVSSIIISAIIILHGLAPHQSISTIWNQYLIL